jgi:hypothetical protein
MAPIFKHGHPVLPVLPTTAHPGLVAPEVHPASVWISALGFVTQLLPLNLHLKVLLQLVPVFDWQKDVIYALAVPVEPPLQVSYENPSLIIATGAVRAAK